VATALVLAVVPIGIHVARSARDRGRPIAPGAPVEGITSELSRTLPEDRPRVSFRDVTAPAGISFVHSRGRRAHLLPEDMGPGLGWLDYDADGWFDLYCANDRGPLLARERSIPSGPPAPSRARPSGRAAPPAPGRADPPLPALYRNGGDGTFLDVAHLAGLAVPDDAYGVTAADLNNDGYVDIHLSCYGPNRLFENNGDGTFRDVTAASGTGLGAAWTLATAAGDFDRDGFLDLYVGNYVQFVCDTALVEAPSTQGGRQVPYTLNPSSFAASPKNLLRNRGDGRFEDVTAAAGVANPDGKGLNVLFADFDDDRWPDIYVGNDVTNNALFRNRGGGRFADESASSWTADVRASMGVAVGDFDADGDLDMFLTHWVAQENALYRNLWNDGKGKTRRRLAFMDVCDAYGLGQSSLDFVKWGTDFIDIDNDGWLDLFVAQGSTLEDGEDSTRLVPERPMLYWNKGGDAGYFDVSPVSGDVFSRELHGRGLAVADYDGDGGTDVALSQNRGPALLLRGTGARGRFLQLELVGTGSNRSALGARVRVTVGERTLVKEVGAGGSYLSQHATTAHFGLASARAVDRVEVLWPSGRVSVAANVLADRRLRIVEPTHAAGPPGHARAGDAPAAPWGSEARAAAAERVR
jgi:hypothetical protein